jgi:hypothetical protein
MGEECKHSLLCPVTGKQCSREVAIDDRVHTLRNWLKGKVKAVVCSSDCAEAWAKKNDRRIEGEYMTFDIKTKKQRSVLLITHKDRVLGPYHS